MIFIAFISFLAGAAADAFIACIDFIAFIAFMAKGMAKKEMCFKLMIPDPEFGETAI